VGVPLEIAVISGDLRILELLLQKGADPNYYRDRNLLDLALLHKNEAISEDIVRILLRHRAKSGPSTLGIAAGKGMPNVMRLLIEGGAKVDGEGENPLSIAEEKGMPSVMRFLMEGGVPLVAGKSDNPLSAAVVTGCVECVKLLLEHRVKAIDNPFVILARAQDYLINLKHDLVEAQRLRPRQAEIAELLVKNGFDPNATFNEWDGDIYSPLVLSALQGNFELVHAIMESPKFDREKEIRIALALKKQDGKKIAKQIRTNFLKPKPKSEIIQKVADTNKSCGICLNEFQSKERVTILPDSCLYAFHPECLEPWLKIRQACPVCNDEFDEKDGTPHTLPFPDTTPITGETKIGDSSPKVSNKANKKRKDRALQYDSNSPQEGEGAAHSAQ